MSINTQIGESNNEIVILVVNYCYWITKNKNITIILNALDFVITLIGKYIPETKAEASKIALKEHLPFYIITATIIPIEEQIIERKIIPQNNKVKINGCYKHSRL
ncbi:hypothetical protein HYE44_00835 [Mycoplasmopsis bovis]|nr:hypothetical protein [Mycoplasmopsis bovis]QQH19923.1 hypothetical protein HYE44_00835 [Mycoplasmopsis bovis]